MSITFKPKTITMSAFDEDYLSLDVSDGNNAATVFALLKLPTDSDSVGECKYDTLRLRTQMKHVRNADIKEYYLRFAEPKTIYQFTHYQIKLTAILAYCLGAKCDLMWG